MNYLTVIVGKWQQNTKKLLTKYQKYLSHLLKTSAYFGNTLKIDILMSDTWMDFNDKRFLIYKITFNIDFLNFSIKINRVLVDLSCIFLLTI